jgi:hypothetical protein
VHWKSLDAGIFSLQFLVSLALPFLFVIFILIMTLSFLPLDRIYSRQAAHDFFDA